MDKDDTIEPLTDLGERERHARWYDVFDGREWSYKALSEHWTDEQRLFGDRAFVRAKAEIERHMEQGILPMNCASFDDLKDANGNAGAYGGLREPEVEDEGARLFPPPGNGGRLVGYVRACLVIRQRITEWLSKRGSAPVPRAN